MYDQFKAVKFSDRVFREWPWAVLGPWKIASLNGSGDLYRPHVALVESESLALRIVRLLNEEKETTG